MLISELSDYRRERFQITQGGEMIILHQHGIMETHAVIDAASGLDRLFLEPSPAGSSLAGVKQVHSRSCHGIGMAAGKGGDAAQAAQEVERSPLGGKNRACGTTNFDQCCILRQNITLLAEQGDGQRGIDPSEDFLGACKPRGNAGGPCDNAGDGSGIGGNEGPRRDITFGSQILGQSEGDQVIAGCIGGDVSRFGQRGSLRSSRCHGRRTAAD